MRYDNKTVYIVGYGESGKASERFLAQRGARTYIYDDKSSDPEISWDLKKVDFAVVSPGISPRHAFLKKLRENSVPVLSEIDLAYINCKTEKTIAVSGTNGKTSVSTILGKMLAGEMRTFVLGNIGVPFVSKVSEIEREDAVVLEVSSFQIEQSEVFRPYAACLTNVGEDHLDRHLTKERYRELKLSLIKRAKIGVINSDDDNERGVAAAATYGRSSEATYRLVGRKIECPTGSYSLPALSRGEAFDLNFLCAFATASEAFGSKRSYVDSYDEIVLPHFRNEFVGTFCGAKVYNDSKGTNIDATIFACSVLTAPTCLILGGSDKGEDYSRLSSALSAPVERVYLVGGNAREILSSLGAEERNKCYLMTDLESALRDFSEKPLPILLFSPASASFDSYSGYKERGEHFNDLLKSFGADLIF